MDEEDKESKEKQLRVSFFDIYNKCSKLEIEPNSSSAFFNPNKKKIIAYAKHFSFFDQIKLDEIYQKAFVRAKNNGLPSKAETLLALDEQKIWTKEDEKNWLSKKTYLETLTKTKAKLVIESQENAVQKQIDEVESEIYQLESKRSSLIGQTCESYANSILNSETIICSLYEDQSLTKPLIEQEDVDYIDNSDLALLISSYNKGVKNLTIDKIKRMSISGFFTSYFAIVEKNPLSLFRVSTPCELSFYQLNLLSYAKVLRSIIRNTNPPKHLMDDPDKLLEWSEKGEKARKLMEKAQNKDKDFSVVGAKAQDYKNLGADRHGEDIFAKKSKSGKPEGELGIMDFVE
jgi:hypothetical protein